jgi:hypothetical protein
MPLWGTKSGLENMPNWLTAEEKERCYATPSGWVYKHPSGVEEVLVSVRNLATRVGAATITGVKFGSGTYTAGSTKQVKVIFNEKVTVTGTPTLAVTNSLGGTVTASYVSTNAQGTTLTFEFTVPAVGAVLSIAAQSVAAGTIVEQAAGAAVAERAISAKLATEAGTKTSVA